MIYSELRSPLPRLHETARLTMHTTTTSPPLNRKPHSPIIFCPPSLQLAITHRCNPPTPIRGNHEVYEREPKRTVRYPRKVARKMFQAQWHRYRSHYLREEGVESVHGCPEPHVCWFCMTGVSRRGGKGKRWESEDYRGLLQFVTAGNYK